MCSRSDCSRLIISSFRSSSCRSSWESSEDLLLEVTSNMINVVIIQNKKKNEHSCIPDEKIHVQVNPRFWSGSEMLF